MMGTVINDAGPSSLSVPTPGRGLVGKLMRVLLRFIPLFFSLVLPGLGLVLAGRVRRFFCWLALSVIVEAALLWSIRVSATAFAVTGIAAVLIALIMLADSWRVPSRLTGKIQALVILAVPVYLGLFWAADAWFLGDRLAFLRIASHSMQPTLISREDWLHSDVVLVDYDAYRDAAPERGDIVVFSPRNCPALPQESPACKRVVGLPGESIRLVPPCIHVNGKPLTAPAIFATMAARAKGHSGYALAPTSAQIPVVLGQTADVCRTSAAGFFVLGDNPACSIDSRYFGEVHRTDILGKVTGVVWPPARVRDFGTE
jgi:signal peptidase I